jgi:hypothetical protein
MSSVRFMALVGQSWSTAWTAEQAMVGASAECRREGQLPVQVFRFTHPEGAAPLYEIRVDGMGLMTWPKSVTRTLYMEGWIERTEEEEDPESEDYREVVTYRHCVGFAFGEV